MKRRWEFTRVYQEGVKVGGRFLVLFLREREEGVGLRLGITATRRVGSAVVRNRCRRRVRALGRVAAELVGERGVDLVVNVRREVAEAPWKDLMGEFTRCLARGLSRLGESASL
ncbi:MAG: ribonuclease P protein component [Thermoanaerobaculaceae bacterium]